MPDDDLRLVVARVPEEDRLPLALTCKPLSVLCIAVADTLPLHHTRALVMQNIVGRFARTQS